MDMRKCKECGKLFQPKGREQYCSDIHYRPCPVCGEPVVVKYLSDPPRRCANCKATKILKQSKPLFNIPDIQSTDTIEPTTKSECIMTTPSKASEEKSVSNPTDQNQSSIEIPPGKDVRRFVGKDYKRGKGFLPNHLYELQISKDEYSYWVNATYDWTDSKEVNITELFSSVISINGHFKKLSEE